jgi:Ni/Co efflux regulator RcnB
MKSSLFRNTIVTTLLAAAMACAMPLSAAAQERGGDGRDRNDSRYSSRSDEHRFGDRDDFYRQQRDRDRRDRDDNWRRGDDWHRSYSHHFRRDDDQGFRGFVVIR